MPGNTARENAVRSRPAVDSTVASDVALLRRVASRDSAAVGELYDRYSRLLFGVIVRILRNQSDAEETLQEVFVRVWTHAETYDERLGRPGAWLVRIARIFAARNQTEWLVLLPERRVEFAARPVYLRIMHAMIDQGTAPRPPHPTRYPQVVRRTLGLP